MPAFEIYFGGQRLITLVAKSGREARELAEGQLRGARNARDPSFRASTLTAKRRVNEGALI